MAACLEMCYKFRESNGIKIIDVVSEISLGACRPGSLLFKD